MSSTRAAAKRPPSYFSTVPHGRRALDIAALAALFLLAVLGFHHVYGGIQYLLTGVMALVFGTLIALIGARWRWGPLRITPCCCWCISCSDRRSPRRRVRSGGSSPARARCGSCSEHL